MYRRVPREPDAPPVRAQLKFLHDVYVPEYEAESRE
jgi:hypothetical protein